ASLLLPLKFSRVRPTERPAFFSLFLEFHFAFGQRGRFFFRVVVGDLNVAQIAERLVVRQGHLAVLVDPLLAFLGLFGCRRAGRRAQRAGREVDAELLRSSQQLVVLLAYFDRRALVGEDGAVERAWILSSTRWSSFRMYMKPIVTLDSYGAPDFPLNSRTLPDTLRPAGRFWSTTNLIGESGWSATHLTSASSTSSSVAPSKTGVATGWGFSAAIGFAAIPFGPSPLAKTPCAAAQPRCVSRIWPMFIRLGTPSGLS